MPVRILILEDDPFIALDLQAIVEEEGHEVVAVCSSVAAARPRLADDVDFALLDVDLSDGKSFEIASALVRRCVPFAFVSGSHRAELPAELADAPFIAKPFAPAAIVRSLPRELCAA